MDRCARQGVRDWAAVSRQRSGACGADRRQRICRSPRRGECATRRIGNEEAPRRSRHGETRKNRKIVEGENHLTRIKTYSKSSGRGLTSPTQRSVAVDNQSGIVLPNDDGIERFSDQAANRADADVPGYVTPAFGIGKAELSKPPRKMLPRVIGDDEERRCAVFVVYRERRRLVSRQKTIRRLIHLRPASLIKGRH